MLRSALIKVPVIALTATFDKVTQKKIVKSLGLRKGYTFIQISPNRKNVKLHIIKVQKLQPTSNLAWLVSEIREKKK